MHCVGKMTFKTDSTTGYLFVCIALAENLPDMVQFATVRWKITADFYVELF